MSSAGFASVPIGVSGKEWIDFVVEENKTLLRENDLEVEGLSESGMSGIMRTVFSPSRVTFFALVLFCGIRFFIDDMNLAEWGLGGNPDLEELGLGTSILAKLDNTFSKDLVGICRDERFGRLVDCCRTNVASSLSPFFFHRCKFQYTKDTKNNRKARTNKLIHYEQFETHRS